MASGIKGYSQQGLCGYGVVVVAYKGGQWEMAVSIHTTGKNCDPL